MLNSKEFVRELQLRHESAWMNPNVGSADAALAALPLTRTDVDDAEARLERFAPFIKKVFPETAAESRPHRIAADGDRAYARMAQRK